MITDHKEYFECRCHSPEHVLRFVLFGPSEPEVCVYTFLRPDSFFKRVWNAVKYVFGYKCRYGHFDEFLMDPKDVGRFIELGQAFKAAIEEDKNARAGESR